MRIVAAALIGWAGIIALAWKIASDRIALCGSGFTLDTACVLRATAARDYVLIAGLIVALAFCLIAALVAARHPAKLNGWRATNPAGLRRLN